MKDYCRKCGKWKRLDRAFNCVKCALAWTRAFIEVEQARHPEVYQ